MRSCSSRSGNGPTLDGGTYYEYFICTLDSEVFDDYAVCDDEHCDFWKTPIVDIAPAAPENAAFVWLYF